MVADFRMQSIFETFDKFGFQIVFQIFVVTGQGCEDGVDGAVKLGDGELGGGVDGGEGVGGEEEGAESLGEHGDVVPVPAEQSFVLKSSW